MSKKHWLAQVNIAYMRAPLEDPIMEGFVSRLDSINALADESPGFVWRLQTDEGDFTSVSAYEDRTILLNLSVWESLQALHEYVYKSAHVSVLRKRAEWFVRTQKPTLALWWVPEGSIPSIAEAKGRLELLQLHGPTPQAFTFRNPFPPPGSEVFEPPEVEAEFCVHAT